MICPVCNQALPQINEGDYHDCENCGSSLRLVESEMEVLQEAENPIQEKEAVDLEDKKEPEEAQNEDIASDLSLERRRCGTSRGN